MSIEYPNNKTSELQLERFVAQELTLAEENDFLVHCESEPQRYREALLAVVEHRRLLQVLNQTIPTVRPALGQPRRVMTWMLATTAVCAAFLFGNWWQLKSESRVAKSVSQEIQLNQPTAAENLKQDDPKTDSPASTQPAPARSTSSTTESQADSKPIQVLTSLLTEMQKQSLIPEASRQRLRASGWQVQEQPAIYLIDTGNGQHTAMPTMHTQLKYVRP